MEGPATSGPPPSSTRTEGDLATNTASSSGGWRKGGLHAAIWTGDHEGLEALLARAHRGPPDFESIVFAGGEGETSTIFLEEEEHGLTPLYVAVLRDDVHAALRLLTKGAHPENGGCSGVPPLFSAAARGHLQLVRVLDFIPLFPDLHSLIHERGNDY